MYAVSQYTLQPKQLENTVIRMVWREGETVLDLWSWIQHQMRSTPSQMFPIAAFLFFPLSFPPSREVTEGLSQGLTINVEAIRASNPLPFLSHVLCIPYL